MGLDVFLRHHGCRALLKDDKLTPTHILNFCVGIPGPAIVIVLRPLPEYFLTILGFNFFLLLAD